MGAVPLAWAWASRYHAAMSSSSSGGGGSATVAGAVEGMVRPVVVGLDVNNLEASCAFYRAGLGFEVAGVTRGGMIYETRTLVSGRWPWLALELRAAFGKRAVGSGPGGLLSIGLKVEAPGALLPGLLGVARWIGPVPEAGCERLRFCDPDGYVIEIGR
jgi:catechol 2,3-dioxygenase-like lactoylglutathione lyase family enzyme